MLVLMVLFVMALLAVAVIPYLLGRYHGMKAAEGRQREREELKRR
jgi:flagellar basal body-associated protein FliL